MMSGKPFAAVLALATLATTAPALADPRLVNTHYNEDAVVRVNGKLGVQATIAFADGESIENVAVGDSQKWQITPSKSGDLLFVKPLEGGARTNMTVVTDKRTYFFDLVASSSANPVYRLRFTYDEEKPGTAPATQQAAAADLNEAERAAMTGDVPEPVDPAQLNFAWKQKGSARLLPERVYDDGDSTFLEWGVKQDVPAILMRNDKGEEGPVNYAVRERTIVIDGVPGLIVLRTGKASATLENVRPAIADNAGSSVPAPATLSARN